MGFLGKALFEFFEGESLFGPVVVDLFRRLSSEVLVRTEGVVSVEPPLDAFPGFLAVGIAIEVDFFILEAAPQTLDKDVVHEPAPAVHANGYFRLEKPASEQVAGKLAPLVGVEDLRLTFCQGRFQSSQAELRLQTVGEFPAQHIAAEPIHHGHQVEKAVFHRNIGDIGAPNLVGIGDIQALEQVRVDLVPLGRLACPGLAIHCLDTHQAHQPFHPLVVYLVTHTIQAFGHPRGTPDRNKQVNPIDHLHQLKVQLAFSCRFIIEHRPVDPQQFALPAEAQRDGLPLNH